MSRYLLTHPERVGLQDLDLLILSLKDFFYFLISVPFIPAALGLIRSKFDSFWLFSEERLFMIDVSFFCLVNIPTWVDNNLDSIKRDKDKPFTNVIIIFPRTTLSNRHHRTSDITVLTVRTQKHYTLIDTPSPSLLAIALSRGESYRLEVFLTFITGAVKRAPVGRSPETKIKQKMTQLLLSRGI